jgi:hypothetical protein
MKKIVQQTLQQVVNESTGEMIETTSEKIFNLPKEPPYIKLYLDDLASLYGLPSSGALFELLKQMNYEGMINLNSTIKKLICERVGFSTIQTLDNYLSKLVKSDVFRKSGRGVYNPNPSLFGRGDWKDICKLREAWLKVEYKANGSREVISSLREG